VTPEYIVSHEISLQETKQKKNKPRWMQACQKEKRF